MVYSRQVGARVKRKEDPRLITGSSTYVDDLQPRNCAFMAVVRSPYPHARIKGIDASAALQRAGVIAVATGKDYPAYVGSTPFVRDEAQVGSLNAAQVAIRSAPMPFGGGEGEGGMAGMATVKIYPIEPEQVRHVGQAVAVVVAEDRYAARDAADLVQVDYEPLDSVADMHAAIRPGAPQLYPNVPNNVAYTWTHREGDPDAAFARAEVVVKARLVNQRVAGIPMETRAVLADPDPMGNGLTVYTSTQNPHTVRSQIAKTLGLPEIAVRVIAPEVGGGFGVKISSYPEDMIAAALALQLRRPIKWYETRSESLATTHHGRDQIAEFEVAAKRDGTVTAIRMRVLANLGAYPRDHFVPVLTGWLMTGVYNYRDVDLEIKAVYTNTMAVGAYRGAGRPEAAFYLERLMDLVADELGLDPTEVRRKNFIPPEAFPYKTPTGLTYDTADYAKALDKVLDESGYRTLRAEQQRLRQQGRYLGIGTATFTEICGFGPYDSANVRVEPSGQVTVMTGISPHGQGSETSFSQIVADELGVPFDSVVVIHGDTGRTPQGIGTMGSRSMAVGGSALYRAIQPIKEKARRIAAQLLEAAPEDVEIREGQFSVKGAPNRAVTWLRVAETAYSGSLPEGMDPGLESVNFFSPPNTTYPFGADVVVVEVHPDTGKVDLLQYYTVDDCGNVVSPLLVEGQVHGGLAQGIGQALWERVVYDDQGQLLTGSLMDYAVPVAAELPAFHTDRTVTPTPINPLGAKGIGELATIGSTPAVANAVIDALEPFGIRHLDIPLTPEKVWEAIRDSQKK